MDMQYSLRVRLFLSSFASLYFACSYLFVVVVFFFLKVLKRCKVVYLCQNRRLSFFFPQDFSILPYTYIKQQDVKVLGRALNRLIVPSYIWVVHVYHEVLRVPSTWRRVFEGIKVLISDKIPHYCYLNLIAIFFLTFYWNFSYLFLYL